MPAQITHVNLQYSHTIGRGEQFGPGFTQPVFMARGEDDLMYVLHSWRRVRHGICPGRAAAGAARI